MLSKCHEMLSSRWELNWRNYHSNFVIYHVRLAIIVMLNHVDAIIKNITIVTQILNKWIRHISVQLAMQKLLSRLKFCRENGPKLWLFWLKRSWIWLNLIAPHWIGTQVVGIVKSCVPNGLGDLFITLKVLFLYSWNLGFMWKLLIGLYGYDARV